MSQIRSCEENPEWAYYKRHRLASRRTWDEGRARKSSEHGPAQYNPHIYQDDVRVEELELTCWRTDIPIPNRPNARYMRAADVVGVCKGIETEFVFAECTDGFVHGRPISDVALRFLGVVGL